MVVLKPPMCMKKLCKEMGVSVAFVQEQDDTYYVEQLNVSSITKLN